MIWSVSLRRQDRERSSQAMHDIEMRIRESNRGYAPDLSHPIYEYHGLVQPSFEIALGINGVFDSA